MRVNIYNEEITGESYIIEKTAADTGKKFVGLRIFLASSDLLHKPEDGDDDRSAVTFWYEKGDHDAAIMYWRMFRKFASEMDTPVRSHPSVDRRYHVI